MVRRKWTTPNPSALAPGAVIHEAFHCAVRSAGLMAVPAGCACTGVCAGSGVAAGRERIAAAKSGVRMRRPFIA
jgi:hypothetical protein